MDTIQKFFNAEIYQVGGKQPFVLKCKGDILNEIDLNEIAKYLAKSTALIIEKQNKKKAAGKKGFGIAKSKPLYFYFAVNGKTILETETQQSLKYNISIGSEEDILEDILDLIEIVTQTQATL
jgi:hypothetical protein